MLTASPSPAPSPRPTAAIRLVLGFVAGALSHLIFQGALGVVYYALGVIPALIWSLEPMGPLGVPHTVNNIFWDGLWGMVYALIEPRITRRFGFSGGGLVFGLAPLLIYWFVVLPLKGAGVGGGFDGWQPAITLGFDLAFGLGTAIIFQRGLELMPRPPAAGTTNSRH